MKTSFPKFPLWIREKKKIVLILVAAMLSGPLLAILIANMICESAAKGKIFQSAESVPANEVGLVLGTSKVTAKGNQNWHFTQRINAAAALFRSGKVRFLLVSGDNHIAGYDEPTDMRDALIAAGVPARDIVCDYAGFRTLDSIVRAKIVFGLSQVTIISEEFHCSRALWIARQNGINAVAFAAPDLLSSRWTWRVKTREHFARVACALDLYVLHRGPKFAGPKEPILLTANTP
ncbi:MAG: ElyC/SanA/YdcF family protein [Verrucomicrobiota bacterium]